MLPLRLCGLEAGHWEGLRPFLDLFPKGVALCHYVWVVGQMEVEVCQLAPLGLNLLGYGHSLVDELDNLYNGLFFVHLDRINIGGESRFCG